MAMWRNKTLVDASDWLITLCKQICWLVAGQSNGALGQTNFVLRPHDHYCQSFEMLEMEMFSWLESIYFSCHLLTLPFYYIKCAEKRSLNNSEFFKANFFCCLHAIHASNDTSFCTRIFFIKSRFERKWKTKNPKITYVNVTTK